MKYRVFYRNESGELRRSAGELSIGEAIRRVREFADTGTTSYAEKASDEPWGRTVLVGGFCERCRTGWVKSRASSPVSVSPCCAEAGRSE